MKSTNKNNDLLSRKVRFKFKNAFSGLFYSLKEEISLVIHFIIAAIIIVLAGILHEKMSWSDWAIIVLVIGFVISLELINTAIENIVDMVSFKFNMNAKKIKDISAAAILVMSISAIIVGLIVLIPKIIEYFQ